MKNSNSSSSKNHWQSKWLYAAEALPEKQLIKKKQYHRRNMFAAWRSHSATFLGCILVFLQKNSWQLVSSKIHGEIEELSHSWLSYEPRSDVTYIKVAQHNVHWCGTVQAPAHKPQYHMLFFLEKTHKDHPKILQRFPVPFLAIILLHLLFTHLMEGNVPEETSPPQIGNGRRNCAVESSTMQAQGKFLWVGMSTSWRWAEIWQRVWKSSKRTCLWLGMGSLSPTVGGQELPHLSTQLQLAAPHWAAFN